MKLALYLTQEDKPYLSFLKPFLAAHNLEIFYELPVTVSSALLSPEALLVSNPAFIKKLTLKSKCNIQDYAGSLWTRKNIQNKEVEILCIPPLKQLITTKPGKFLLKRFLSKLFKKEDWPAVPPFTWGLCDDIKAYSDAFSCLSCCDYISCDIETSPAFLDRENKEHPQHVIVCVAYSAILFDVSGDVYTIRTFVIPVNSVEALQWVKKINLLDQPKIFQNGKYDNFYFLRFNAPVRNWLFDTLELHHAFLSELPKNLGYLASFYIREVAYWKDEGQTGDLSDLYSYNAKDAWATAIVFITQVKGVEPWAITNYLKKFPLVYPCLASELDGLLLDKETLEKQKVIQYKVLETKLSSLRKKLGTPSFNPRSFPQCLRLLKLLGNKNFTSSDEKHLEKAGDAHPLARLIVDEIKDYREASTLTNTFLEAELWNGKLLYTLNPSGTDTGRLASRESSLWCGTQLQNLPPYYKQCIWAEEGFFLGEGDNEQSESRCTAYLSGDENLIAAVESPQDFHATNASAFFGLSYDEIIEEEQQAKKLAVKPLTIRDLSKRVNHGATYNMQERVLLETMGVKNVVRAQALLSLPKNWTPIQVCKFLIDRFTKAYPVVKGDFYDSIIASIKLTRMLVSCLGWTRLCFGTPWTSKPDLNSYVAHVPSNLSVAIINEAYLEIFNKLHLKTNGAFRLKGQIHDSILFAYKEGRKDLALDAKEIMTKPKLIRDCKGKERWMTIPVSMKGESRRWTELKTIQ